MRRGDFLRGLFAAPVAMVVVPADDKGEGGPLPLTVHGNGVVIADCVIEGKNAIQLLGSHCLVTRCIIRGEVPS